MKSKSLKVLIVSSEVSPCAKTGGLGDIIALLGKELRNQNIDARVVFPKYKCITKQRYSDMTYLNTCNVKLGSTHNEASIFLLDKEQGIYTIGNDDFFNRDSIYGYDDDFKRFAFFTKASLEFLKTIDFKPDIIHFNDWQVGLGSFYLKEEYAKFPFYKDIKTLYTIHNIQYQGNFKNEILHTLGISYDYYHLNSLEFYYNVNYMKAGILYSDAINTVSETYAKEIQTPNYGYGIEGIINSRKNSLYGILNGINYDSTSVSYVKDKAHLQNKLNLEVKDVPIIAVVSRLVEQKGLDIILGGLNEILSKDVQMITLGTGHHRYEHELKEFAHKYPKKLSANIFFGAKLSIDIYKNADIFLMPSLFEPCGISQMLAMEYGTVPVVRKTGGLNDTVKHYNSETKEGNGFVFEDYDTKGMLWALNEALKVYENKEDWKNVVKNALNSKFSVQLTAQKYIDLYTKIKDNKTN